MTADDIEANQFAMELLMPTEFLKKELAAMGCLDMANDKHVKRLADRFKVPVSIMALRLSEILKDKYTQ